MGTSRTCRWLRCGPLRCAAWGGAMQPSASSCSKARAARPCTGFAGGGAPRAGRARPGKEDGQGRDFYATAHGHVSITPLKVDLTDHDSLADWAQTALRLAPGACI